MKLKECNELLSRLNGQLGLLDGHERGVVGVTSPAVVGECIGEGSGG